MRKWFFRLSLTAAILFSLAGCIAGAGKPYDDSKSVYKPTITLNKTVINDDSYKLTLVDIVRKSHPDVGDIVEVNFKYNNKTDKDVFVTTDVVKFDDQDMSVRVMAFFDEMTANSDGTVTAIFQEIKDKGWTLEPLTKSLEMELQIVNTDSETIATYPLSVSF